MGPPCPPRRSSPTCTCTPATPAPAAGTATWSTWPGGPRARDRAVGTGDLVPPGLGGGDPHQAVPAEPGLFRLRAGPGAGRRWPRCRLGTGAGAVPAVGGDLDDLQAGRATRKVHHLLYAPDLGVGGRADRRLARIGNLGLGRPADPRARLPRPAGDAAGLRRGRLPGAGARLDALVRRARLQVRVRLGRGLLRRPGRAHLRDRDRAVVRPGDEPPGLRPGPLPAGLATPTRTRRRRWAGRRRCCRLRASLLRGRAARWRPVPGWRDDRVLPRGGQVPPRRAPDLRGAAGAGRDPGRGGRCPVCGKPVTVGVLHRVEALADRAGGRTCRPARRAGAAWSSCRRWWASCSASAPKAKSVEAEVGRLVDRFGPELSILQDVPLDEAAAVGPPGLSTRRCAGCGRGEVCWPAGTTASTAWCGCSSRRRSPTSARPRPGPVRSPPGQPVRVDSRRLLFRAASRRGEPRRLRASRGAGRGGEAERFPRAARVLRVSKRSAAGGPPVEPDGAGDGLFAAPPRVVRVPGPAPAAGSVLDGLDAEQRARGRGGRPAAGRRRPGHRQDPHADHAGSRTRSASSGCRPNSTWRSPSPGEPPAS